jgi:hypothetical protein
MWCALVFIATFASLRANCAATLPSWDTLTTCFFVTMLCALAVADGGGDADAGDIDDDDE